MATYIGKTTDQLQQGENYPIQTQDMTGRIYQPGKKLNEQRGLEEWIDKEGKPDERIMAYGNNFYKVYQTAEQFLSEWNIDETVKYHSPRIKKGWELIHNVNN